MAKLCRSECGVAALPIPANFSVRSTTRLMVRGDMYRPTRRFFHDDPGKFHGTRIGDDRESHLRGFSIACATPNWLHTQSQLPIEGFGFVVESCGRDLPVNASNGLSICCCRITATFVYILVVSR